MNGTNLLLDTSLLPEDQRLLQLQLLSNDYFSDLTDNAGQSMMV
jgi:hypothetical protein